MIAAVGMIVVAILLIYRNVYVAPFIFDDVTQILQNQKIQTLSWPWEFLLNNRRPVLYLSLAFDYYHYGENPWGYHLFNICVHCCNAAILFFLIYQTCRLKMFSVSLRKDAGFLAFAGALLWACHPIQTQAVTYIIQRAESLMTLFFLISVLSSSRYLISRRGKWLAAAGISGILSGLTKEVALALPVIVFFYDRAFVSKSWKQALRQNIKLYFTLALSWAAMLFLFFTAKPEAEQTAGFGMKDMPFWLYGANQPAVIYQYVRLALWPNHLVFYYDKPPINDWGILAPQIIILAGLIWLSMALFRKSAGIGFLILAFFAILAPSSSFIPVKDLIFEYRMYLPLACLAIAGALALRFFINRFVSLKKTHIVFFAVIALLALLESGVTFQRNKIYLNEEKLWTDVVSQQPWNARAYNNLGEVQYRRGNREAAIRSFFKSIDLNPTYAEVYVNASALLAEAGQNDRALDLVNRAIKMDPGIGVGYYYRGMILSRTGKYEEAVQNYKKAVRSGFINGTILRNLSQALDKCGRHSEAQNLNAWKHLAENKESQLYSNN